MTFVVEEQRRVTRDEWVAHELELAGLPPDDAYAIGEACEDLARSGVMPFFAAIRAVIDAWLQDGTWGPIA